MVRFARAFTKRHLAMAMATILVASLLAAGALTPEGSAAMAGSPADDDACGLLTDREVLRATGSPSIVTMEPGARAFHDAGCAWLLEPIDPLDEPWELYLDILRTGGAASVEGDAETPGIVRLAGIGDAAYEDADDSAHALLGDTLVSVQFLGAFGTTPRLERLTRRALLVAAARRLDVAGIGPTATPAPTLGPVDRVHQDVVRLRTEPFGPDNVDAAIDILARSGIGTYEAPDATAPIVPIVEPASPLVLLREQVRAMALEAWAGGGIPGEELDALIPSAPDLVPASFVLAGYVAAVDTAGAQVARALMGDQEWAQAPSLAFPQLVLTLFTSDIARERTLAAEGRPTVARSAALALAGPLTAQGGPCSAVSDFISGAISRVFEALRLTAPADTAGRIVTTIWNFVVSLAEETIRTVVRELGRPVLDLIGRVAGTVGLVATVVSAIRPWAVSVVAVPYVTSKGGESGQFLTIVDLGGLDRWPPSIEDCARVAGRPLPNLKPEGAPVAWDRLVQQPDGLVAEGGREARLDANGVARLDYVTLPDESGSCLEERTGALLAGAAVSRPQLEQLRDIAIDQLLGTLPDLARNVLDSYLRPTLNALTERLTRLVSARGSGPASVIYHVPASDPGACEDPEPGPPIDPPEAGRAVWVHLERPASEMVLSGRVLELVSCSGAYGPWNGWIAVGGIDTGELGSTPSSPFVPFTRIPVTVTYRGTGGIRSAVITIRGEVPTAVRDLSYEADFATRLTVDGAAMQVEAIGATQIIVGGSVVMDAILPIEPAPDGRCP